MKNVFLSLVLLAVSMVIINSQNVQALETSDSVACVPCDNK